MSDFLSIEESKQKFMDDISKNASFIATVISQGELKSGTKDGDDWMNKKFTLDDGKTREDMIVWNDDIKKLKVGYRYEFNSPYWTESDKYGIQLNLGQYCEVKCIGTEQKQETLEKTEEPKQDPVLAGEDKKFEQYILIEHRKLSFITKVVQAELGKELPDNHEPRGDVVWVRTLAIYEQYKKQENMGC